MTGITSEQREQLREWARATEAFPPRGQEEVAIAIGMALAALEPKRS